MVCPIRFGRLTLWFLLIASATACTTPVLTNGVFRSDEVAFRVGPVPSHWQPVNEESDDPELASFAFHSNQSNLTVGVAARCRRDGDDVPLRSLTQHLYVGFTDRHAQVEKDLMLDGRAALRTDMVASLDGVPQHLTFVVLKKDGCVYDFWQVAARPVNDTEFDAFVGGFQVLHQ